MKEQYNSLCNYLIEHLGHKYDFNVLSNIVNGEQVNFHINAYRPGTAYLIYCIRIRENDIMISNTIHEGGMRQTFISV